MEVTPLSSSQIVECSHWARQTELALLGVGPIPPPPPPQYALWQKGNPEALSVAVAIPLLEKARRESIAKSPSNEAGAAAAPRLRSLLAGIAAAGFALFLAVASFMVLSSNLILLE